MPVEDYEYGNCWCMTPYQGRYLEVRLKVQEKIVVLSEVPQGVCDRCAFKVYKPEVLWRLETLVRGGVGAPEDPDWWQTGSQRTRPRLPPSSLGSGYRPLAN